MRRFFQILLPVLVLAIAGGITYKIIKNPKKPNTRKSVVPPVFVETLLAKKTNFPVIIETQGETTPRIQSKLIPEISGKVIKTSSNFFAGKFFKKGEILVEIDSRDYEIALEKAKASLLKAETVYEQEKIRTQNFKTAIVNAENLLQQNILKLKEEIARSEQALIDWKRLGRKGEPGELVLRKPQMAAAKAAVEAAKAEVEKAKRDLSLTSALIKNAEASVLSAKADLKQKELNLNRCKISAPFDGRIVSKSVDLGQYTSPGNAIADIYGIHKAEVKLPVSAKDLQFMSLPEDSPNAKSHKTKVLLKLPNSDISWQGILDRTDSKIDSNSRQQYVIAQIDEPFSGEFSLKPGTFVNAVISGREIKDVFVIPITAIRESSYVWLVNEESTLQKKLVTILWRNKEKAVVSGLSDGDKICITTLTFARNNLPVQEKGSKSKK